MMLVLVVVVDVKAHLSHIVLTFTGKKGFLPSGNQLSPSFILCFPHAFVVVRACKTIL